MLIVGGRQSAFEWAALLAEEGAARVDVVHRHDTPEFTESDWSFVDDMLARTRETRGWFRSLPDEERAAIAQRFWQVGRLQLEPWLAPRIARDEVHFWPRAEIAGIEPGEPITVTLSDGTRLETDHILLATGYRVDMRRVPYLPEIELADGFPVLDADFQSSVARPLPPRLPLDPGLRAVLRLRRRSHHHRLDHRRRAHVGVRWLSWMLRTAAGLTSTTR